MGHYWDKENIEQVTKVEGFTKPSIREVFLCVLVAAVTVLKSVRGKHSSHEDEHIQKLTQKGQSYSFERH